MLVFVQKEKQVHYDYYAFKDNTKTKIVKNKIMFGRGSVLKKRSFTRRRGHIGIIPLCDITQRTRSKTDNGENHYKITTVCVVRCCFSCLYTFWTVICFVVHLD